MACANMEMDIISEEQRPLRAEGEEGSAVRQYQATELMPEVKGPLHDLLQKQPAVLGSLQMVSGFLSVGVGLIFATAQQMEDSLFTMFRVAHMTGALFVLAGIISNLLFKYPQLLQASFGVNCGCISVALIAACLISVDLAQWRQEHDQFLRMEVLQLCVLGLEVFLSTVLCFWFFKEKRAKSQ